MVDQKKFKYKKNIDIRMYVLFILVNTMFLTEIIIFILKKHFMIVKAS